MLFFAVLLILHGPIQCHVIAHTYLICMYFLKITIDTRTMRIMKRIMMTTAIVIPAIFIGLALK